MMRALEADVAARGRRALGAERFNQAFAAGLPLRQREAIAEARALREATAPKMRR
jgi:hypothetical protein